MALARYWLESCDKHPSCNEEAANSKEPRLLPKRLLSVGSEDSPYIRLQKTSSLAPDLRYMALSFFWGSDRASMDGGLTFPHNLKDHEHRIDFDRLPKTCRDAIVTVRRLGIEYLWIDSLCIVQGPGGDFQEEAQNMESIFRNAYCILAACSSSGVSEGFLKPRRRREAVALTFPTGDPIFVCKFIDDFAGDVDSSLLYSRGWAFQERVLARRTIFFTSNQMYWQCGEGIRCETLTKMSK